MKKAILLPLILGVTTFAMASTSNCRGCASGKLMLQCDYYVVKQGDMTKRSTCEEYAGIVDVDGASAKAAWYYLLAGNVDKALDAAERAIGIGHAFANEYAAYALLIQGKEREAAAAMKCFREAVHEKSFVKRDIETLKKFYPSIDFSKLDIRVDEIHQ
jgi:tetratricopeptide (TPR) repeat protein